MNGLATRIGIILPQYTSLALHWSLARVNILIALRALISAISLFVLPFVRERYIEPWFEAHGGTIAVDLFISQISLVANTIGIFILGLSTRLSLFIVGLCVYTSGAGLGDSLISFGTHTLPQGQLIADFYVRTGLINAIAALIGGPIWNAGMNFAIRHERIPLGTPLLLCVGLFCISCVGVAKLRQV